MGNTSVYEWGRVPLRRRLVRAVLLGSQVGGPPACVPRAVKSDGFLVQRGRPRWVLGLPCCNPAAAVDQRSRGQDVVENFVD